MWIKIFFCFVFFFSVPWKMIKFRRNFKRVFLQIFRNTEKLSIFKMIFEWKCLTNGKRNSSPRIWREGTIREMERKRAEGFNTINENRRGGTRQNVYPILFFFAYISRMILLRHGILIIQQSMAPISIALSFFHTHAIAWEKYKIFPDSVLFATLGSQFLMEICFSYTMKSTQNPRRIFSVKFEIFPKQFAASRVISNNV